MRMLVTALMLLGCAISVAHAQVVLVKDGREPATIYTTTQPAPQEKDAAAALARYLSAMSGAKFEVATASHPLPQRGVFVGPVEPALSQGLPNDGFRIITVGQQLHVLGGNPQGVSFGVFSFLETEMGCRWWSHDEEDVPKAKSTLTVPPLDRIVRPTMSIHNVWNREASSTQNNFNDKLRNISTEKFSGGHTLYPLLTPYSKDHPEILPMDKEGQRKANDLHFCYLAPNIAQALADALELKIKKHNGDTKNVIYFAGMGDWYGGMCECSDCKNAYEEEAWVDPDGHKKPGYTGTLLRMINQTAEMLEKNYPGIRVGTFAYMSLEAPPGKTKPRDNVIIRIPRLRHCTVHPAESCDKNRSFLRNTERWCDLAPKRVYIWEYGVSFKNFLYPFPALDSIAANLRLYQRLGVRGVEIQGNYVSMGSDLVVPKNYVWSKLMWDPKLEPRAVLAEFCEGYYGPAAKDVIAYIDALEKSVREPKPIDADEFSAPTWLTVDVKRAMTQARDRALAAAAGKEPYDRRVREATIGLEAHELWRPGPLKEDGDRLVREDLGGNTMSRARDMTHFLRGSGATEWGGGRAQQLNFLTLHGGPLLTLTRGDLRARIAPMLRGQVRQVTFRGKDLLYIEEDARTKGYPHIGGSIAEAGVISYEVEGAAEETKVTLRGDGGIGSWSSEPKQLVAQFIELTSDNSLTITAEVRRRVKTADQRGATVNTSFMIGKGAEPAKVECEVASDQWVTLKLPVKADEPTVIPPCTALRVTLTEQGCVVTDRYTETMIIGGKLTMDGATRRLGVSLITAPVVAPEDGEATFLRRKMEVTAIAR